MTEEKPLSEGTEQDMPAETNEATTSEEAPANTTPSQAESVAAALSALSSAAAPIREESVVDAPSPEDATISFTSAQSADEATSQAAPPPPPAPDSVDSYPAPIGVPIPVNAIPSVAPSASAIPPAPTVKRKKWPWILAICIVAGIVMLGGIAACTSAVMSAAFHTLQHNERYYDYDDLFNHDTQDGLWNYYYGGMDTTFESLLDTFNVEEGEITADGLYARGAYRVGGDNGIAPGLYYLEGSQNGVSNFFVFHSENTADDAENATYDVQASVEYFGNYYAELVEGDAIFYVPFSKNSTMFVASDQPMDVVPPYKSGCYRVGIDIPAGTYTITCDADAARETDSEAGAYVMKDLAFDADSIIESALVIKGGRQTITVENGQYLELFAAIATPATASTKTPLQHAESERSHVA